MIAWIEGHTYIGLHRVLRPPKSGHHIPTESQQLPPAVTAALERLKLGLPNWHVRSGLPPDARAVVAELCSAARKEGWSPEQLVVAVKNACYTSDEIVKLNTTSERDALLSKVVTACIKEFFKGEKLTP